MTKEENKELCKKYPFLLPYEALADDQDIFNPRTDLIDPKFDFEYTMYDDVPVGWKKLFLDMCDEILSAIKNTDTYHHLMFSQVKEKFGELRVYADNSNDEVNKIIDKYTDISLKTCICCGEPATRMSRGWISPFCDKCIGNTASDPIVQL